MGIASSTESKFASSTDSDSRYNLTILQIMEEGRDVKREEEERPEKEKLAIQAAGEATREVFFKELHALFSPKLEESSTDLHTKRDEDEDLEVLERFCAFMKGGDCKESFKALGDCLENTETVATCKDHLLNLKKCMDAHIGYYEPILALAKVVDEKIIKEMEAIDTEQQPES